MCFLERVCREEAKYSSHSHPLLTTMLGLVKGVLVNGGLKPSSVTVPTLPQVWEMPMTWHHSCLSRMGTSQRVERAYKMWGTGGSSPLSPFLRFL